MTGSGSRAGGNEKRLTKEVSKAIIKVLDMQNWWNDCTKGTRLEGRTTWNSGWVVELIEKLAKEGKTLQDLPFFQQAAGKGVMNPVKKNAKKNAKKKAKK